MAAPRAAEMPLRTLTETNRQHHGADNERTKATSRHATTSTTSNESATPQIIECRKKNAKGEMVITHRYYKGRLLGKGGFAHCYKVTCVDTMRVYAMKIVPKSSLTKTKARQKLQTEIKIHRTLAHPRIVRFEMFFEDKENVYILLELCSNHSLSELIRRTKRFTEDEARRYMLQILEATSYLHRHQIIHRDLKLGNVFLDKDWNVKMGDFGLATKLVQDSERKRTICGTPNYIAPEILEGTAGHSYQVDLWSAGVILYTMLIGRPPYESTDVKSTYRRILANVYTFPDAIPVSDSAKNLVGRLLQVKPELRPSLDEVLNHPFLRNGGPPKRFSTAHGLRSAASSSSATASSTSSGSSSTAALSSGSSSGSSIIKKLTPERGIQGGRPPLTTRSSNLESGDSARTEVAHGSRLRSSATSSEKNAAQSTSTKEGEKPTKANGDGVVAGTRRSLHPSRPATTAISSAAAVATSTAVPGFRAATSRKTNGKAFDIFCDDRGAPVDAVSGRPSPRSGRPSSGGGSNTKRTSPQGGRRKAPAEVDSGATGSDKENDPRSSFAVSTRVTARGHVSRRPLIRAASTAGGGETRDAKLTAGETGVGGNHASTGVALGTVRATGARKTLLRSASNVATTTYTTVEGRGGAEVRTSANALAGVVKSTTATAAVGSRTVGSSGSPAAASPRVRATRRVGTGVAAPGMGGRSPVTKGSHSSYKTFPMARVGARGGATGVGTRLAGSGDGTTPPPPRRTRSSVAQEKAAQGSTRLLRRAPSSVTATSAYRTRSPATLRSSEVSSGNSATETVPRDNVEDSSPQASPSARLPAASEQTIAPKSKRDTLETMHDLLTRSFAMDNGDPDGGELHGEAEEEGHEAPGRSGSTCSSSARSTPETPPLVWVTRYVDYSSKYGLGFLLSDGSAGVYFNDATKIVLDPAGVEFDYIERARRSTSTDSDTATSGSEGCRDDQPPRMRYGLEDFPPELRKKVTLLNHFRGYLNELVKKDDGASGASAAAAAAAAKAAKAVAAARAAAADRDASSGQGAGPSPPTLIFLKKWLRTRNAILFRLSNRTVQVVFSDYTEIILSREARVVTYVDKEGNRETLLLQRVLEEQRTDVTNRVRYSKELIAQLVKRV